MKIELTYSEISRYLLDKHGQRVEIERLAGDTVKVTARIKKLTAAIPVSITLRVVSVTPELIIISHPGGLTSNIITSLAMRILKKRNALAASAIVTKGHLAAIQLNRIPALAKPLTHLAPEGIAFTPTSAELHLQLK